MAQRYGGHFRVKQIEGVLGSRPKGCRSVHRRTFLLFCFFRLDLSCRLWILFGLNLYKVNALLLYLGQKNGPWFKNVLLVASCACECECKYNLCGFDYNLPGTISCSGHHKLKAEYHKGSRQPEWLGFCSGSFRCKDLFSFIATSWWESTFNIEIKMPRLTWPSISRCCSIQSFTWFVSLPYIQSHNVPSYCDEVEVRSRYGRRSVVAEAEVTGEA